MAKFLFDTDYLNPADRAKLSEALAPVAESDATLIVELSVVGEEEIRTLNRTFRGVDKVTDVLSFPALDGIKGRFVSKAEFRACLERGRLTLGSIAVCEKRAIEQAEEYGHGVRRELFYLVVHGVLHCLGYDHEQEADKREMRAKEEEVMRRMDLERE